MSRIRTQALLLSIVPLAIMLVLLFVTVLLVQKNHQAIAIAKQAQLTLGESAAVFQEAGEVNRSLLVYSQKGDPADLHAYRLHVRNMLSHGSALLLRTRGNPTQFALATHYDTDLRRSAKLLAQFVVAMTAHDRAKTGSIQAADSTRALSVDLTRTRETFELSERNVEVRTMTALADQFGQFALALLFCLLAGIALTLLVMFCFGIRIVNRLRHLGDNARRLEHGETPLPLAGKDEIAELDQQYRSMALRMHREHDVAATLQQALLPQRLPRISGLRVDTAYMPAASDTEVGGDWYDIFELPEGNVGISIGDVAGHGLRAATSMATTRQSIRTAARFTSRADDVLGLVNRLLCDEDEALVTAFFGVLNMKTGALQYALAGHPQPLTLGTSGDVELLDGNGLILGLDRSARYERYETVFQEGSALVLYTDGVVETLRGDYNQGVRNLIEAIGAEYYNSSGNIAEAIHSRVFRSVGPRDDSAVMFIGITELETEPTPFRKSWSLDAKSVAAARRVKRALLWHIGEYAVEEADMTAIELIFGELLGNVARHTPGSAEVTLELSGEAATLHVQDFGDRIVATNSNPGDFDESGRGLFLIRHLAREVRIVRQSNGNRISAVLPISVKARIPLSYSA